MKTKLDCVICLQQQALRILRLSTTDQRLHDQTFRQVLRYLTNTDWNSDPMTLSKGAWTIITRATGNPDPYQALKRQSNQQVLDLYPQLRESIRASPDPLLTACKMAIAGNIMDFGPNTHFNIHETIHHVLHTDFAINHYHYLQAALRHASSLLLFADNAGEIVFDKLLLETMQQMYGLDTVTVVIKKLPILNDATLDDVGQIGLADLPNLEFRYVNTSGNGSVPWFNPEVSGWIQAHDVVIAKGQANYEVMSAVPGIFFLLIAKCALVAADTETTTGALILKFSADKQAEMPARSGDTR